MTSNLAAALGLPYSVLPLLVLAVTLLATALLAVPLLFDLPHWVDHCAVVAAIVLLGISCAAALSPA